jgi:hypothetical protein
LLIEVVLHKTSLPSEAIAIWKESQNSAPSHPKP